MQYILHALIALPITVDPLATLQVSFSVPDGSHSEECNETQATIHLCTSIPVKNSPKVDGSHIDEESN